MAKQVEQPIGVDRSTLGLSLRNGPLRIPNYQREYSWKNARIKKLFDDLSDAMRKGQQSYFLGTMLLTPGDPPSVVDGQQRLATTTIFLAAVRDAFLRMGEDGEAKTIEGDFLFKYDRELREDAPRLLMNTDDRAYMRDRVLDRPDEDGNRPTEARFHSHRRIDNAALIAADRVNKIIANADTTARKVDALNQWVQFIDKRTVLAALTSPSVARAYQMYKTVNDRAQRTTPADMIKNHLFEQAESIDEAQAKWSTMRSIIEGIDQPHEDDPTLEYLHAVTIIFYGPVTADDIFEVMEDKISSRNVALSFLDSLAKYASDYAAIVTPSHPKWGQKYDAKIREYVTNIAVHLKMPFIRTLMLATAARFKPAEAKLAFKAFVAWVVRFLIAGGHRSGVTSKAFGQVSHKIAKGEITTASDLVAAVRSVIPNDVKFEETFRVQSLSNSRQARFILRELEAQARQTGADALLQPVEDTTKLTLEHVLPRNPNAKNGWGHFSDEERKSYRNRLGNLALVDTKDNGAISDRPFSEKRPIIKNSENLRLTADIIKRTKRGSLWTAEDITRRQEWLAELALARWPIDP